VSEHEGERQWVVEPPAPGEVKIFVAAGGGAGLSAEQEGALVELVRALDEGDAEVTGLAAGRVLTDPPSCHLNCPGLGCGAYSRPRSAAGGSAWTVMGTITPRA
jgi:hypothetical protein